MCVLRDLPDGGLCSPSLTRGEDLLLSPLISPSWHPAAPNHWHSINHRCPNYTWDSQGILRGLCKRLKIGKFVNVNKGPPSVMLAHAAVALSRQTCLSGSTNQEPAFGRSVTHWGLSTNHALEWFPSRDVVEGSANHKGEMSYHWLV